MISWFLSWVGMDGILYLLYLPQMQLKSRKPGFSSLVCLHMKLCLYKISTMYGFTQFYLVCFFLLTLRKAVLLTFKSKGVFFDVDTQKCLL